MITLELILWIAICVLVVFFALILESQKVKYRQIIEQQDTEIEYFRTTYLEAKNEFDKLALDFQKYRKMNVLHVSENDIDYKAKYISANANLAKIQKNYNILKQIAALHKENFEFAKKVIEEQNLLLNKNK